MALGRSQKWTNNGVLKYFTNIFNSPCSAHLQFFFKKYADLMICVADVSSDEYLILFKLL